MCKMSLSWIIDEVFVGRMKNIFLSDFLSVLLKGHLYSVMALGTDLFCFSVTPALIQVQVVGYTLPPLLSSAGLSALLQRGAR